MAVDRDLLWKAWPDGYLAMRGVSTVGDFICTKAVDTGPRRGWHFEGDGSKLCIVGGTAWTPEHTRGIAGMVGDSEDDLLPNLDPVGDPATWACALADLTKAAFKGKYDITENLRTNGTYSGILWANEGTLWRLSLVWPEGGSTVRHFSLNTVDQAVALAIARAQLQEVDDGIDPCEPSSRVPHLDIPASWLPLCDGEDLVTGLVAVFGGAIRLLRRDNDPPGVTSLIAWAPPEPPPAALVRLLREEIDDGR